MLKSELKIILEDQQAYYHPDQTYVNREIQKKMVLDVPIVLCINGVRRSGKSTLLKHLYEEKKYEVGYLHFDDPRLNDFEVSDFYKLEELWPNKNVYQFDEIQKVDRWEEYVRQASERKKVIGITGSNAHLLSRELATLLTGRTITYELMPFSYSEYLKFSNQEASYNSFLQYFEKGGFPEHLQYNINGYLNELFHSIVQHDIAVRYGVRNVEVLQRVALHILNNCSRLLSYSGIAKHYHISSVNTVSSYLEMLREAYLIFQIPVFSYSYKKQVNNPKKVYAIDHAFAKANSTGLFNDYGRVLENMVYLQIRRWVKDIYYYRESGSECDFVFKKNGLMEAVQSCWEINDSNKNREINGIIAAMNHINIIEGWIVTSDQEDEIVNDGKKIFIIPFWKWTTLAHSI